MDSPPSNPTADFAAGSNVVDANNPSRVGVATGRVRSLGLTTLIEVAWGPHEREFVPSPLLKTFINSHATIESKIAAGEFGGSEDLRRLLTFEKLRGSLNDFIYSMEAAGINFLEYQFKPVLKFIESPTDRLLIADEVGLGKTIESALIWLELRARRDARRLLVVCPKMIAGKWRKDLREKFNVSAEVTDFKQLRNSFADFKREGNALRFAWICTYSGLRPTKEDMLHLNDMEYEFTERGRFVKELNDLNPGTPSFFDLVICDEAHYMRNSASAQSKLGTALGKAAAALLLVSATPVNNSNRDLFTLLRILDPEFFENDKLFQALLEENRPAVQALNALSCVPPNIDRAIACADELASSSFVGSSELLDRLREKLQLLEPSDTTGLVAAQELAERLNILGSYVTRMRRAQVKEKSALRCPLVVTVSLTPTERKFYAAITHMVRMNVAKAGKAFSAFHLVMPQQRMASCIPAMVKAYRSGELGDFEELLSESFDIGEDSYSDEGVGEELQSLGGLLEEFRDYDFEANDSKYAILRKQLLEGVGGEKVIIFSYFRGTLAYLNRRLEVDGIGCAMIHGGMLQQEDRDSEIERFRTNPGIRVFLSSEVGSEGIDLQFCHILVNYDLPWNPMRIEQRIGRIDRVGQEADRLIIVHLRILDTIEDRLYTRLHEKLLRFQNSIGDLEPIIGKEIQELTLDLMRQDLSPEEEEARIMQTERVLTQRLEDTRRLEESGESLLAHADYISSQVNRDRDLGRYVSGDELKQYIDDFFANNFLGSRLQWDHPITGTFRLELTWQAHDSLTDYLHAQKLEAPPEMQARIVTGTLLPEMARTKPFVNQRRLILVNHLSPLVRWITFENQQREGAFYNVSALRVKLNSLPAGLYAYRIERWRLKGLRNHEVLSYACAQALVVFYIERILRDVHRWIQRRWRDFGEVAGDTVYYNMAVPVAHARDSTIIDAFQECLNAAVSLVRSETKPDATLADCIDLVGRHKSQQIDECALIPEVTANVQSYIRSRGGRHGLYLFADVGAGTVDFSVFIFYDDHGDNALTYPHAAVEHLGSSQLEFRSFHSLQANLMEKLRLVKEGASGNGSGKWEINLPVALDYTRSKMKGEITQVTLRVIGHTIRKVRRKQFQTMEILYGGGGCCESPYEEGIEAAFESRWGLNAVSQPLPVPDDVDWPENNGAQLFKRFSVAYGLSFLPVDHPIQHFPDEIGEFDPAENHPRRETPAAPSKDEV